MRYSIVLLLILFLTAPAYGQDMRKAFRKAETDYKASISEAKASEKQILEDRSSLKEEIARLKSEIRSLNRDIASMQERFNELKEKGKKLSLQRSEIEMDMRELVGTVRTVARDLESTLRQSFFTARLPQRIDSIEPILKEGHFPGMGDLKTISDLFFQEMALSGEVALRRGTFVDSSGMTTEGDILTIGKFSAAYRSGGDIGFLNYSEGSRQFFALSIPPPWSIRHNLGGYMKGKRDDVCLDLSGGAALRQITHKLTFLNQIRKGGPIIWPILAIGLLALILIIERIFFLKKVHHNTDIVMGKVNELASQEKWEQCGDLLSQHSGGPVHNVLIAGLASRDEDREVLESVLQESILRELPRLERFLPIINILGAIAPLLGLLGTVTGMISTFHVITLYGTGDPRMMSGGISEALVTTELGLAVAIPIMLLHTFLSRRVEHITADMEEKAVALTNIIQRQR
jgi:biopolymer transport protein ExbB